MSCKATNEDILQSFYYALTLDSLLVNQDKPFRHLKVAQEEAWRRANEDFKSSDFIDLGYSLKFIYIDNHINRFAIEKQKE